MKVWIVYRKYPDFPSFIFGVYSSSEKAESELAKVNQAASVSQYEAFMHGTNREWNAAWVERFAKNEIISGELDAPAFDDSRAAPAP